MWRARRAPITAWLSGIRRAPPPVRQRSDHRCFRATPVDSGTKI
jgi:hypothetical protein